MTNREYLLKTAVYDALIQMNERLNDMNHLSRAYCILDLLDVPSDYCNVQKSCKDCIAAWLNTERKEI